MRRDDAAEVQVRAADPEKSTWLSANAGSGKTRVLTDRVARLLLAGTEPQRILCLTYTKAAASEMQNRLFRRLGRWAMLEEAQLRAELAGLGVEGAIGHDTLARARRLFARAIETPGGLKIQTIHSFCASLLRRFPLEARVSPDFTELEDRAAILMRQEIVEHLAAGEDREAVDALARLNPPDDLTKILAEIRVNSDGFRDSLTLASARAIFGLPEGFDRAALWADVCGGGEADLMSGLIPLLAASSANDVKAARALAACRFDVPDEQALIILESELLYGEKAQAGPFTAKIGAFPTKKLANGRAAPLMPQLEALMRRVEAGRGRRLALAAAENTAALHRFAGAFLPRYQAAKAARGFLDFDDLITRTADLLSDRSVAAWVLYRLDGGIDHVLVDEAQDTSPGQWRVIESLTDEFTAGHGASAEARRIFVVGDKKQSIYSFQGADLVTFDSIRDRFAERHRQAAAAFVPAELLHSFRSSQAILSVVDLTFDARVDRGLGGPTRHIAYHVDLPGRVDLWAPIEPTADPEPSAWDDPVDVLPATHHTVQLARRIAAEIRRMIDAGVQIPLKDGARPVHEGDFLILVRRRSALFQEIIRACKAAGLAVAGADRLKLGAELAVKDLTALLSFLATPEDDLSLAAVLRSPLFGWTEADLFRLAHGRQGRAYLWQALREGHAGTPTLAMLDDLRGQADFLRPFELIERVLTRHDGRRKLLARLGPEAEDGIDALLAEALGYERAGVPSLTGFLVWMQTGRIEVKRRLDSASRSIRVMTVHGAKGLEAPIVILPDTAVTPDRPRESVVMPDGGPALWKTAKTEAPPLLAAELARRADEEREESMRLLYVAMTRAETWLIVAAAGKVGSGTDSWYSLVADAVAKAGATSEHDVPADFGPGLRHFFGIWPPAARAAPSAGGGQRTLPAWVTVPAAAVPAEARPLSPSDLGGDKALPGEAGLDQDAAKRRGTLLHRLLEHLPGLDPTDWPEAARNLLAADGVADLAESETILAEAVAVLQASDLARISRGSLAEVEIAGRLPELGGRLVQGVVDRLVVEPERVLAIDFKSNAVVPARPEDVPEGVLRQMGAYQALLALIWPGRRIETAIVWTRTATLMPLPPQIVRDALRCSTLP